MKRTGPKPDLAKFTKVVTATYARMDLDAGTRGALSMKDCKAVCRECATSQATVFRTLNLIRTYLRHKPVPLAYRPAIIAGLTASPLYTREERQKEESLLLEKQRYVLRRLRKPS